MKYEDDFEFYKPGLLQDGELKLELRRTTLPDPLRNWAPAYEFDMRVKGERHRVGRISLRVGSTEHIVMYAGHIGYRVDEPLFHCLWFLFGHRYSSNLRLNSLSLSAFLYVRHSLAPRSYST